ncbi:MAG: hypothetical protein IT285_04300 [Bdellovibrionales bacterium]|nr:hypothetical protein [Bdellovibrionales bacterium]
MKHRPLVLKLALSTALIALLASPAFAEEAPAGNEADTAAADPAKPEDVTKKAQDPKKASEEKKDQKKEKEKGDVAAPEEPAPGKGARASRDFGLLVSVLGEPVAVPVGFNFGYQIFPWLRGQAGFGSIKRKVNENLDAELTTFGLSAWTFIPGWNFSPTVGLGFSKMKLVGTGLGADIADLIYGLSEIDASLMTLHTGFEWQTNYGLNIGFGVGFLLGAPEDLKPLTDKIPFVPYFHLGWFFDFI